MLQFFGFVFTYPGSTAWLVWSVFRLGNGLSWVKDWTPSAARVSMLWSLNSGQGWTAHQFVNDCTVISGGGGRGCGGNTVQNGFTVSSGCKFGVMLSNGWDYTEKMVTSFG